MSRTRWIWSPDSATAPAPDASAANRPQQIMRPIIVFITGKPSVMDTEVKLHAALPRSRRNGDRALTMLVLFRDTGGGDSRGCRPEQGRLLRCCSEVTSDSAGSPKMLFEPERHQALSPEGWDEQIVRATIHRIVADTIRDFSATTLWPTHPDDAPPSATFYNLYIGAAGVIWALDYLKRSGATDTVPDFSTIVVDLVAPNRARFARFARRESTGMYLGIGGLLSGDSGILLTAARLNGIPTVVAQIGEAIDGNADNPCREFMYGAPGTAVASLAMWRETGNAFGDAGADMRARHEARVTDDGNAAERDAG